jgi:aspartate 1-decarboxylase
MMRPFLRCRIEAATVTEAKVGSPGSLELDQHLMHAAGLQPFEKVEIYNLTSGARFETYIIKGQPGSGQVRVSGAAAHLAQRGDKIAIASYGFLHAGQILEHKPKLITVDEQNRVTAVTEVSTG